MGKKGGSQTQTTKVEYPEEIRRAAEQNLDIANEVAAIGYSPYSGPTIAGFSPQQLAGMQSVDQGAAAFGMPSAVNWQQQGGQMAAPQGMSTDALYRALTGMAPPNAQAGGFSGYSAMPLYQAGLDNTAPAQLAATQSFFMDPVTGAPPVSASVPAPKTQLYVDPSSGRNAAERRQIAAENARRRLQQAQGQAQGSKKSIPDFISTRAYMGGNR